MTTGKYILLFDGECNLCNRAVQIVIKHDKKEKFMFASLQSEPAKAILDKYYIINTGLDTFILIKGDKGYLRSRAALEVARALGGLWQLLFVFIIVPSFIRDMVYNFIAKRRYKFFGKTACMVPTPELKSRFLE